MWWLGDGWKHQTANTGAQFSLMLIKKGKVVPVLN
jgi:hypothetical protein